MIPANLGLLALLEILGLLSPHSVLVVQLLLERCRIHLLLEVLVVQKVPLAQQREHQMVLLVLGFPEGLEDRSLQFLRMILEVPLLLWVLGVLVLLWIQ